MTAAVAVITFAVTPTTSKETTMGSIKSSLFISLDGVIESLETW